MREKRGVQEGHSAPSWFVSGDGDRAFLLGTVVVSSACGLWIPSLATDSWGRGPGLDVGQRSRVSWSEHRAERHRARAAQRTAQSDVDPLLFSSETWGGFLNLRTLVPHVQNGDVSHVYLTIPRVTGD